MDKVIIYRRKSSDVEDRQILSLDSQATALHPVIAAMPNLAIVADYEESQSAKGPGRPMFDEMCVLLESGKANHIAAWNLNRLARNPVCGGRILWLVQHHGVRIITPVKTYGIDDALLMHIEFAMSSQFIADLSKATRRGLVDKAKLGYAPFLSPVGYVNDTSMPQGARDIKIDPERFSLVRKMWDLLLTRAYSPNKIREIATTEWGLTQKSGHPISRSKIYDLFSNFFYTGSFYYQGTLYEGKHMPMISEEEFDRAQNILGERGNPRPSIAKSFAFTGSIIKCSCGSSITAESRFRKICPSCHHKYNAQKNSSCPKCSAQPTEQTYYYCYYHCTKRKNPNCKEPAVSESNLTGQIEQLLKGIQIPQEFCTWALNQLRKAHDAESKVRQLYDTNDAARLDANKKKLDNLFSKYIGEANQDGGIISDTEYKALKLQLLKERNMLEENVTKSGSRQTTWIESAEEVFNFAKNASHWFKNGTEADRRIILSSIGSNLRLHNKILCLDLKKPFEPIKAANKLLINGTRQFEPVDYAFIEGKFVCNETENTNWGG